MASAAGGEGLWGQQRQEHPRVCGEHDPAYRIESKIIGSSPRTRGTPVQAEPVDLEHRIIPAHAGNTFSRDAALRLRADHPRARGEHQMAGHSRAMATGSSPRTRGTRRPWAAQRRQARIIPAHAGNTKCRNMLTNARTDHPRARGEHKSPTPPVTTPSGSSPRTRGTRTNVVLAGLQIRIIPAHAGNTHTGYWSRLIQTDHPRARGEHGSSTRSPARDGGSSPRTRGTPRTASIASSGERIIPAHAGNTCRRRSFSRVSSDHPRARGEHATTTAGVAHGDGSSPRTRGTPAAQGAPLRSGRIIPAHAGNTTPSRPTPSPMADHPRARGEHALTSRPGVYSVGSSPRTRGTRLA